MDSENEQSSHQVKTQRFVLDNKHKCQIKRKHSSTHVSLPASAILFRKLCRLFQISSRRDGRDSKSGRRPIERLTRNWNCSSNSGSSTVGPNEPANGLIWFL